MKRFEDPSVAQAFAAFSPALRKRLLILRQLILHVAASTDGVGPLEETLKWGEPAYLTTRSKSGSTIRIGAKRGPQARYAIYFNCQTTLVDTFRTLFPQGLEFEGNRAIVFDVSAHVPIKIVSACIRMALTYRRDRAKLGAGAAVGMSLGPALAAPHRNDLTSLTLSEASELLRSGTVSAVELTQACLDRIGKYNSVLNAFITVTGEQALAAARQRDAELRRGKRLGPLHGIPIAVKDNIDTAGVRTTAASELFKDRVPQEDAEVVHRLKDAGAILLGKTNLQEFAYGGSSAVSFFRPVHNPWALERVPGGSSGGSAAAAAAGLCFGSLGTDTAGSVRMPASYCGIVGLKATYGRVSNRGAIPLSWTLDQVGPLCRTVRDTALMLEVIAGFDTREPTSADVPVARYSRAITLRKSKLRLGLPRQMFFEDVDPEIAAAVNAAIDVLRPWAESVRDVALPALPAFRFIMGTEAYAYHVRWMAESPQKYQPSTRERIVGLSAQVSKEDYVNARRACDVLRREIRNFFADVDVLIMPTVASPPSLIEPIADNAARDPERTRNCWPFDVTGLPAISVPCGFSKSGLPIGLQIVGAPFAESTVLALAYAYEQATEWHRHKPTLLS